MLFSTVKTLISGGEFDVVTFLVELASMLFVVFCLLPVHEFAHAFVATKLGDDTPRLQGRLTLSPFAHIDPLGAIMMFIFGFGYAKPVPVNIAKFKNPRAGFALTALAGPVSNLIMALFSFIIGALCARWSSSVGFLNILYIFFIYAAQVNVSLAVFNLLPVPPLDGSRLLAVIIPQKYYFKMLQYERYIVIVIFALLFTGILSAPINFLESAVSSLFMKIAFAIAGIGY